MRATFAIVCSALGLAPTGPPATAQDSYRVEALAEAPPEEIAAPVREALQQEGLRVLDAEGTPVVDLWLRKSVPAAEAPGGPSGSILLPFLEAGQLVGAMRLEGEAGDYKDQVILPGVYTMRYGLQPVDGDHLGVSEFRDYFLLSYADEDVEVEPVSQEDLQILSSGPSGTTHPSVFLLLPAPEGAEAPSIVRDEQQGRTGVLLSMPFEVDGEDAPRPLAVQVVVEGAGPH
ncbi:hypothetical protein [Tautonia plasticadhaerens]|uniref:Uncharacterized protein n=1 Tax=Tautonia plasticadhaerens TaxID=2527974 RepID=A0A518HAK3_9BACT|nr:hypothetical protein [Tautonia plasticadhaerens]QDV37884.1 hypothetical protein ElP_58310 [Tautonia plasticadhaerens]